MEEQTPNDPPNEEAAAHDTPPAVEPAAAQNEPTMGLCSRCDAIVPLVATTEHEGKRFHHPPPPPAGYRRAKGRAVCGPVFCAWRYRIVYFAGTDGPHSEYITILFPLTSERNFKAIEAHLARNAKAERATIVNFELLAKS